jgi:hypothetical protein
MARHPAEALANEPETASQPLRKRRSRPKALWEQRTYPQLESRHLPIREDSK